MSWRRLARKDVGDAVRDRTLPANALLLGLFGAALGYGYARITGEAAGPTGYALQDNLFLLTLLVAPMVAVLTSYAAVSGERAAGRLRLTLPLGYTRRDVVAGAFAGRTVVNAAIVLAGLAAALSAAVAMGAGVSALPFLGYAVAAAGLMAAFTAVGVALSAALASRTLALVCGLGVFALAWLSDLLLGALYRWLWGAGAAEPAWLQFCYRADPLAAFQDTAALLAGRAPTGSLATTELLGPPLLLAWVAVPLWFGYRRFAAVDL